MKTQSGSPNIKHKSDNGFVDEISSEALTSGYGSTETVAAFECTPGCAVAELDAQSGVLKTGGTKLGPSKPGSFGGGGGTTQMNYNGDSGGASRFFYCSKPSRREKNEGLDGMPLKESGVKNDSGRGYSESDPHKKIMNQNFHPTVKSLKLMAYLIKMVTPPGGIVLDCFGGSGTTLVASHIDGFRSIVIEKQTEYCDIILARAEKATDKKAELIP